MKKVSLLQRAMALFLCLALLASYAPIIAHAATPIAQSVVDDTVTDPGTADSWEHMMGTAADGNRYAGRVWADKSVYKDGDTVTLNSRGESGSSYTVSLEDDETFQTVFSVLGSSMTTTESITKTGPMDVVLVLDDSTSMDDKISGQTTRLEKLIEASNRLLSNLTALSDIRIGIVAYNQNSIQVLPFGAYNNGIELRVLNNKYTFDEYNNRDKGGTIQAFDKNGRLLYNNTAGYARGTNTQAGIHMGMTMLENAANTRGRIPVAIVLTDGSANTAAQNTFYNIGNQTPRSIFSGSVPPSVALATLLTAAYKKARVEDVYGRAPVVYGIGVDIAGDAAANAIINPGASKDGFNSSNSSSGITDAYELYTDWAKGTTVEETERYNGSYKFTFDHGYTGVTLADIKNNIHYVDTYYPVSSADLNVTFDQIYEELASSAFNPISSSTSVDGATGVDNTPLIYVDFIGQYMEVKEIEAITLFGASYGVTKNADGTYTVNAATGVNPTTNELWNTAEDIRISVTDQPDNTQKLEIRINQEILPIILEQVKAETINGVTSATITELTQNPLRVFYTVGIDSDILLPNGKVDVSKIPNYRYISDADGTISFYSNRFGEENKADNAGAVAKGDAHIGFRPSPENRYYYHQKNQGIFTGITDSDGKAVTIANNNEYGIVWNEDEYSLNWMTYAEYKAMLPDSRVYTYVTYYRPTPSASDPANAAEEVTYLVYTDWKYLKESVAFYDDNTKTYLNEGKAMTDTQAETVIAAYLQENPNARLYAVLGVGSRRTSRLHNMMVDKTVNATGTAAERYTPEYLENTASHNDNDVVIWLGNNGKLTVEMETGIALTKAVTEAIGNANDTYALTVTVPAGVTANPVAVDANGNTVESLYAGNVLTVSVKAGQTVYISGIPGGTVCAIGETVNGDYYIDSKTDTVRVPLVSEVLSGAVQFAPAVVTNAPNKYANLYITKSIASDHTVPQSILDTPFNITVNVGAALTGKTFAVKDSAHSQPYNVTVDANGKLSFQLKARQTVEILSLPQGTAVTVTEENPGSHFQVSYATRNHSGETEDADNAVVIPGTGSATAVITNRYTPASTTVDLDIAGTKNFVAEGSHPGGSFTYKVQKWNGAAWEDITGKTAETPYAAGETGTKHFTISDVLAGITYTEAGSHAYQVVEVKGNVANVTYDRTLYTFTVTVTDNGGQLVAAVTDLHNNAITGGAYEVVFNNTYHTVPISVDVKKIVKNPSNADSISLAGFEFTAIQTDDGWNALPGATPYSVYTDAAGEARFTSVYAQAGVYRFVISETDKNVPGWTYSGARYRVTVTVEERNGDLTASLAIEKANSDNAEEAASVNAADATRGAATFVNTYAPDPVSLDLDGAVIKSLTGMELTADQFTFYIYNDGDRTAPILTGVNDLNGDVRFVDFNNTLTFVAVGTYRYDIVENIPTDAVYNAAAGKYALKGMYYDPTVYDLVVEVTNDEATGKLTASYYFEDAVDNTVTFYNEYRTTPTEYILSGAKLLHGRAPRDGEFTFQLFAGDALLQTVTNKADGSFAFEAIPYTQAGRYTYTIREAAGNAPGVTYDGVNAPITVTVTVTDTEGVLTAAADVANADIRFENAYAAESAKVIFNGRKFLEGGSLTDGAFTFNLYATDYTFAVTDPGTQLLASVKNTGGEFKLEDTLSATGTYYYVIEEDTADPAEGIVYDRTRHTFTVQVSDDGNGQLKASVTDPVTGHTTAPEAVVSTAVAFTNATFDQATEKEVYLGENTTRIDGQKVSPGDTLTYRITYTNYTGEAVAVEIMDAVPVHTAYVEGSASHDGSYAGEHILWVLNVAKGESVTVSFQITVKETETDATISNIAAVRDGVNTYATNEVVNPIDVPEPEPTEPPTEPTEPPTEPTEPPTEPSEPPTEPSEPPAEPSEPPAEPSEPTQPPTEPPTKPADPSEPPKTGDNMHLGMWFAALFVSTGGMIVTLVLGKRKPKTH